MMPRSGMGWHLLTTFGLGYRRPASGTWGSLPPVLVAAILFSFNLGPAEVPWIYYPILGIIFVVFTAVCVMLGDDAEARWGYDPAEVVADETAGQSLCLLAFPLAGNDDPRVTVFLLLTAFFAFRFFDITKLPPSGALQAVPGGWGIVLDDLVAGLYAAVVLAFAGAVIA